MGGCFVWLAFAKATAQQAPAGSGGGLVILPGVPANPMGAGSRPGGRVPFLTREKEPKARSFSDRSDEIEDRRYSVWIPSLCRRVPAGTIRAGSRTGGRVTFLTQEKSPKVRPRGSAPLGIPPLSCTASLSFRRPGLAAAPVPPTPSGLLHPYALTSAPHRGAWPGIALGCGAPLEAQAHRLERQI